MPLAQSDRQTSIVTLGDRTTVTMEDRPSVTADTLLPAKWYKEQGNLPQPTWLSREGE